MPSPGLPAKRGARGEASPSLPGGVRGGGSPPGMGVPRDFLGTPIFRNHHYGSYETYLRNDKPRARMGGYGPTRASFTGQTCSLTLL